MSEHLFVNSQFKPHYDLGPGVSYTDAEWDVLKAKIVTLMTDNAEKSVLHVHEAQELDAAFLNERTFGQACADLNLFIIRGAE